MPILSSLISSTVEANNLLPSYEQLQYLRKKLFRILKSLEIKKCGLKNKIFSKMLHLVTWVKKFNKKLFLIKVNMTIVKSGSENQQ